jgi:glycosyltransferase involved in cell wall biosynthesis
MTDSRQVRAAATEESPPLVSAVVPTYGRRPDLFRAAVESVRRQTYDDIELVVVDDSPENVSAWLDGDDAGFTDVVRVRNGGHDGAAAARNTGIRAASGSLIGFLDDDDRWFPTKVERQVAAFTDEAVGLVCTGQQHGTEGTTTNVSVPTVRGDVTEALLSGAMLGPTSTAMVRAAVVRDAGELFDERLHCWEDKEWYIRLSRHCLFEPVQEPLVYRHSGAHEQLTDASDFETLRDRTRPLLLSKHRELAAEFGSRCERRFVATTARLLAAAALSAGRYGDARRYAGEALRHAPGSLRALQYLLAAIGGRYTHVPLRTLRRQLVRLRA